MKSVSLRTCLVVIAVLAAWLAAVKDYAYEPRPYRSRSLIKVDPPIGLSTSPRRPPASDGLIDRASARIESREAIARALADPVIAALPGVKALPDPVAEVGRSLTASIPPGTTVIMVVVNWPSGPEAAAIVNKVVADAVATDPDRMRQINLAIAGGRPFRPPISFGLVGLFTLAAATAVLLLLAGPRLLAQARASVCQACGRWGFSRVEHAA